MKLADYVDSIRELIYKAFDKQFGRLGIGAKKTIEIEKLPEELHNKRNKLEEIIQSHIGETGTFENAREKALEEFTFTLFNRIAAIKVMEAHQLFPPIITKESIHGDRSFGHKAWLEENPSQRNEELEGLREYIKYAFNNLANDIALYSGSYPYALLPHPIELDEIINAFNAIQNDTQIEDEIWKNDDILGWLYESYNNAKKQAFKDSKDKTEYDKVSLQSQVYTPKWVVEFLVNNSLGKLYLEMYPNSNIKNRYKIANAPQTNERNIKPLHEIKLIDPACGSGNFLLYAYDLFYELYMDQIDNFDADYEEKDIPKLIIENNICGIDLDDRAIQLATLGLYIKAKQNRRTITNLKFNVISSDFFLPDFEEVKEIFETSNLMSEQQKLVEDIWDDLKYAYKFGSLVKVGEKIQAKVESIYEKVKREGQDLFNTVDIQDYYLFEQIFFKNLESAVQKYASSKSNSFLVDKTSDAITFLKLVSQKYDVATANPPYTSRREYGDELREFIDENYREPYDTYINLYACILQRLHQLLDNNGKIAMVTPMTFMFISTFKPTRELILSKYHINLFVHYGFGGMFSESVDPAFFVLEKDKNIKKSNFIKLDTYFSDNKKELFKECVDDLINYKNNKYNYDINQNILLEIKDFPFIYWISDDFRNKFKEDIIEKNIKACVGLQTGDNNRFLRYWWEIDLNTENNSKWIRYAKGGTFNKWAGNLWLTVNWDNNGYEIKNFKDDKGKQRSRPQNESMYFKKGVTYSASGRGGYAFRILPEGCIFDVGGSSLFPIKTYKNNEYVLALLNSKLVFYIANCLNPTANIQVGDIQRIPFVIPDKKSEQKVSSLSSSNIELTKYLLSYNLEEYEYNFSLFEKYKTALNMQQSVYEFIKEKLYYETIILINEYLIDKEIFNIYSLSKIDIDLVENDQGKSSFDYDLSNEARDYFLNCKYNLVNEESLNFIKELEVTNPILYDQSLLNSDFSKLFNSNKTLEDIAIEHRLNPIEIYFQYIKSNIIPTKYKKNKGMEYLIEIIREILLEDDDGIIPLVQNAGEKILYDRVQDKFVERGFTQAQFSSFDNVLNKEVNKYINENLFEDLSDHTNLFSYLPKTPFIWHLSSGKEKGFEAFIIIYKWSRDNLLRLRSVYIENVERALTNKKIDLQDNNTAEAQNKKDTISKQLKEIDEFKAKIDELLEEGYDPKLDDGVGKNIAPLQKKNMISYDVLNAGQLKKYLNADW